MDFFNLLFGLAKASSNLVVALHPATTVATKPTVPATNNILGLCFLPFNKAVFATATNFSLKLILHFSFSFNMID